MTRTYVQFAAKDLSAYLTEISGKPVTLSSTASPDVLRNARTVIAIGEKMALAMGADLSSAAELGGEGSVIRSFDKAGTKIVVVAGTNPHGTNLGVATLMGMIRREDNSPYLEGPLDLRNKPSIRGSRLPYEWRMAVEPSLRFSHMDGRGLEALC